jgi:hypothetical protein
MDWTMIVIVALICVAVMRCATVLADAPRIKRESACEHDFQRIPVFVQDEDGNKTGDLPVRIDMFCRKCGCKRET